MEYQRQTYQPSEGKNIQDPFCLRIYAVRLTSTQYVISGGAIKLTHRMSDHHDTKRELMKVRRLKEYLKEAFSNDIKPDMREL